MQDIADLPRQSAKHAVNRYADFLVLLFLSVLTYALHKSALDGYWRFDDGGHLNFAVLYAPWQYFLQPTVMLLQSYAHITPYNALFYDINLSLFGMTPMQHYAHLLAVLAAVSFSTYRLMRLWHGVVPALLAAVLFLAGLPTLHVAQQLMTGHYATGLLFTVLSLHCFAFAVRQKRFGFALLGAALYVMATACKEVYVPLVLVLLAIPVGDIKERLKAAMPYVAVAVFYTAWRYAVLGQLAGGYIANPVGIGEQLRQLLGIPLLLLGWTQAFGSKTLSVGLNAWPPFTGLAFCATCLAIGIRRKRIAWGLVLISLPLLLMPLIPLARNSGINEADRYLFLVWWASAVLAAALVGSLRNSGGERILQCLGAIGLIAVALTVQSIEYRRIAPRLAMEDALYQTVLQADAKTALMPPPNRDNYRMLLTGARRAAASFGESSIGPIRIVVDAASFCEFSQPGHTIVAFDETCQCMKDVSRDVEGSLGKLQSQEIRAQAGVPLRVKLSFQERKLHWDLGPHTDGIYSVLFGSSPTTVPAQGKISWAGKEPLRFRVRHESADGRVAISPSLLFDMTTQSVFSWGGQSIVEASSCTGHSTAR